MSQFWVPNWPSGHDDIAPVSQGVWAPPMEREAVQCVNPGPATWLFCKALNFLGHNILIWKKKGGKNSIYLIGKKQSHFVEGSWRVHTSQD